jgi:peptidylprolyl isomerase
MVPNSSFALRRPHGLIGKVVDGYGVVQEMEKVGSNSGTTKEPVVVEDCGQIIEN